MQNSSGDFDTALPALDINDTTKFLTHY